MSTESHKKADSANQVPRHADVSFEQRDIRVSTIYGYLLALGVTTLVALVICIYILRFTTSFVTENDSPPPVSRDALGLNFQALPPEPRLQGVPGHTTDPQEDLRDKLKADRAENEKFAWIDRNAGIAQIPVNDAMKIVAEKGLSVVTSPSRERK